MLKKILISVILFVNLFNVCTYALDFSSSAVIENKGEKKYKAIKLTPQIYNNIRGNSSDIMLYNNDNEVVPFFINSFVEKGTETKKTYEMKLINSFVKDKFFFYDYVIKTSQSEDITATSIEVQTDNNGFAKQLELWGGYDNISWEKVQDDILYKVDDSTKLSIVFNNTKKYTHYRFKLSNNLEKIAFTSVELNYNNFTQRKEYFTDNITPEFTTEESEKRTIIKITNLKNLKIDSITIESDSVFKRNVDFEDRKTKVLYNLAFENTNYRDMTIPLDGYKVTSDIAEMHIDNKDDRPIKISKIIVKYVVDEIIFDGSNAGNYTLRFGDNETQTPKNYDIESYKEQILNEGYDVLNIKEIKIGLVTKPVESKADYKLIFNIVISVVAIIMGFIIFRRIKK
jgi:hypothetical protein